MKDWLGDMRGWLDELKTLNTNLEALAVLLESYKDTGEAIQDVRTILAELLGWKVIAGIRDE